MSIYPILKMGEPTLAIRSVEVEEFGTEELFQIIQDLKDSIQVRDGVGIAAPQIGINKRIIVYGFEHCVRYPNEKPVPIKVLINPVIEPLSDDQIAGWEGCLSVPTLRGKVLRFAKLRYLGFDERGQRVTGVEEGFSARILQHECDHIDGFLFPERIIDMKNFGFEDVLWGRIYGEKNV